MDLSPLHTLKWLSWLTVCWLFLWRWPASCDFLCTDLTVLAFARMCIPHIFYFSGREVYLLVHVYHTYWHLVNVRWWSENTVSWKEPLTLHFQYLKFCFSFGCQQSGSVSIPTLSDHLSRLAWIKATCFGLKVILHWENCHPVSHWITCMQSGPVRMSSLVSRIKLWHLVYNWYFKIWDILEYF